MKPLLIFVLFFCVSCSEKHQTDGSVAKEIAEGKWIDLSYDFSDKTLYWPTANGFKLDTAFHGVTDSGFYYEAYNYCAAEHGGTHLDAPSHFAKGKWSTDQIPLDRLTGDAAVIDVSNNALKNADYLVTIADIEGWEKTNGRLPGDIIILFRTGYGSFYPDAKKYLGTDERGADAVAKLHFPGIDPAAAEWLVKNRKIKAVGVDVASVDYGQSKNFKTHQILYEQNIPGFENVANLDKLPVKGAFIVALPMKIKGGSGGPLRIVGIVPGE
ncbi:MAG TPA: cyclase family protein [Chitinophagaceae bacterium]|jgi:kynurenine formamidase|nr:cyclase family protein [Chitinophagaceae bacterium]